MYEEKFDNWLETFTGTKFNPYTSPPSDVKLLDIIHSLSLQCRFGGHCRTYYSIAEHSVYVSKQFEDPVLAKWGLFHDAAEAYLTDLPRPLKKLLPDYNELEQSILTLVAKRFDLPWPIPDEVREMDTVLLRTESLQIMTRGNEWVIKDVEPLPLKLQCLSPEEAEIFFMNQFNKICN